MDEIHEGVVAVSHHPERSGRPAGSWVVPAGKVLDGPGGEQLERALAGHVATEAATRVDLLACVPRPVEGHVLSQEIRFGGGGYVMGPIRGGFDHGLGLTAAIAPEELPFVLSFDGTRSLAELLDSLDEEIRIGPEDAAAVLVRLVQSGQIELATPG